MRAGWLGREEHAPTRSSPRDLPQNCWGRWAMRTDRGSATGIRLRPRGAPPPTPPRTNYVRRGENFGCAPAGLVARGTPQPARHLATSAANCWGRWAMRTDRGSATGIRLRPRGAPPPTPPPSFLGERGEFECAPADLRVSATHAADRARLGDVHPVKCPVPEPRSQPPPPLPRSLGEGSPAVARNERKAWRGRGPPADADLCQSERPGCESIRAPQHMHPAPAPRAGMQKRRPGLAPPPAPLVIPPRIPYTLTPLHPHTPTPPHLTPSPAPASSHPARERGGVHRAAR
jgi:hypothetical protein